MLVHVFRKQGGWKKAITCDETGGNLPTDEFPWVYEKQMDIEASDGPRIGASSQEIIDGINKEGYFIWPLNHDL